MNKINWKAILPHGIAVVLFLIIAIAYNSALLDGSRLVSHDDTMFRGEVKELVDSRQKDGQEPLWANRTFSGMPAYTISYATHNNVVAKVFTVVAGLIPTPAGQMFWAMLCFYILLITFGFKPYASVIGAISYGFCSYNIGIITAGHYAKLWAIAFFPLIVAGINLIFKKKYLWGAALTAVATSVEILVNHPQMTYYYFVFFLSIYMVYLFVNAIVKKEVKHALISSALAVVMILIGVVSNANKLLPTQEYTQYSTRGPSELTQEAKTYDQTPGLDRSYIVGYSSGKDDIYSFLVPNYKGFNSGNQLIGNEIAKEAMGKDKALVGQVEGLLYQNYGEIVETYWGGTDLAGGGIYCSVLMLALFLLSFIFVKHPIKWLIIPGFLITLLLSWGKNYMDFTNFFIDHFPMYNKFRAVNSIIIVITFMIPLLASFMLARLANEPTFLENKSIGKYKNKHVLVAGLGVIALVLIAMYLAPTAFQSFTKPSHMVDKMGKAMTERELITEALTSQQVDQETISKAISTIEQGRIAIFKADVLRSLLIMILGGVAIALYAFKVYNWKIMLGLVGLIVLIDVWTYDQRFLSPDTKVGNERIFQQPKNAEKSFAPTTADQYILADPSKHKRVLNLSLSPFNDGTTSYYHQSLGGYSGAKLKRYQELVERGIYPNLNAVFSGPQDKIDSSLAHAGVLNMLNTKYFIFDSKTPPLLNRHANGAAWTLSDIEFVKNADEEIAALKTLDTKNKAVSDQKFKDKVPANKLRPDSTAQITLTQLSPRLMEYDYISSEDQIAVFSEIYYPAGWKAYIDGTETDIIRVNYVLRALYVTKGKHKIEFIFDPASHRKGETYSLIASILMLLTVVTALFFEYKNRKKTKA
jgi:hypothetical protein